MISYIRYRTALVRLLPQTLGLALLFPLLLAAQTWDVHQILDSLRSRFQLIEDYQVDLNVSLNMPMLRMPRKKMTFTFKQPDKTHLKARGFAMVPRRGLALSPDSLFQRLRELTVTSDTLVDGHPCLILRGLEKGPSDLTLLAEMMVDRELWLVRGITTHLEGQELFRLWTEYVEVAPGVHMPGETHLRFQINERFIRGRSRNHRSYIYDPDIQEPAFDDLESMTGEASIVFSNYRVNLGISDEFFSEEER